MTWLNRFPSERRRSERVATRPTLLAVVRRAHVSVLVTVLLTLSLPMALAGGAVLLGYARHNLDLIARSVAYTVEAATVFRDPRAAADDLKQIADRDGVAEARIEDAQGRLIADYRRIGGSGALTFSERFGHWLWPEATVVPIVSSGRQVGRVLLRGDPTALVQFALIGVAGMLTSVLLVMFAWRFLIARLRRDIVLPLRELVSVTRHVIRNDAFGRRAPGAAIFELNELSEDFNALLAQVEEHQARLRKENESLAHQALHDSLTGLPNRAYFSRRLGQALESIGEGTSRLAVMVLDSDRFKAINDAHGHAGGDVVLAEVARRVRAQLRESDVVARVGGDEFVVLLAPLRSVDDALRVADKIIAAMAQPVALPDGTLVTSSLSVGVAVYPDHADSIESLMQAADRAMYRAKRLQRGSLQSASAAKPSKTDHVRE